MNKKMVQERPTTKNEVAMGALSGVCSGYLFKKVSKYAAATAVIGYIAIQGASQAGYIKINWSKVNDTIEDIKEVQQIKDKLSAMTADISEIIGDEDDTLILENEGRVVATARRAYQAVKQNAATSGSFTAGFIIGVLFT